MLTYTNTDNTQMKCINIVICVLLHLCIITSERNRVLRGLGEKSRMSDPTRPNPAPPDPTDVTLFRSLYLRNRTSDLQTVFFDE